MLGVIPIVHGTLILGLILRVDHTGLFNYSLNLWWDWLAGGFLESQGLCESLLSKFYALGKLMR